MTSQQINIINVLVLTNLVVYGVLGFAVFVFIPEQGRVSAQSTAIALQSFDSVRITTEAADALKVLATNTAAPTITPAASRTPMPTITEIAIGTATPWELTFIWQTAAPSSTPRPLYVAPPVVATTPRPPAAYNVLASAPVGAPPAALSAQGGDSPSHPMTPGDSWHTLVPGASVWYKLGKGGDHMDVFLDANPLNGVTMEVYTPDNLGRPIGQGTLQGGRLVWAGGHWSSIGDWLGRVANGNAMAVSYKLTSATREIGTCDSYSYWEHIGTALVYWTACR